jgi:hypothetical protein
MMYCGPDLAVRCVAAEAHRELKEFSRSDRGSANPGQFGGGVERIQRQLISGRGGQCQVSGLQLRFFDDLGQTPMHRATARRGGVTVDTMRQ